MVRRDQLVAVPNGNISKANKLPAGRINGKNRMHKNPAQKAAPANRSKTSLTHPSDRPEQPRLYSEWPEKFEAHKLEAKISWLGALCAESPFTFISITKFKCDTPPEAEAGKLSQFDDIACKYNDTMNLKIIKFINNCSRMTSKFDFMFLNYVRKDDFERAEGDTYISSTYKLSAEAGEDFKPGPLKIEAKIGGGIEFEFGRQGLEDVTLIGEIKVGAGTGILDEDEKTKSTGIGIAGKDAFPTTVEAGVEGRISIISGKGSVSGTGVLEDIKITEWKSIY